MKRLATALLASAVVLSCTAQSPPREKTAQNLDVVTSRDFAAKHKDFKSYWFRGLAEMNRFSLQQARYGEIHEGEAVMIFVTEPFLPDKQIKQDFGNDPNALQVLKNNAYRRFYTGVYPYTILTTTFTPAMTDGPTIKLTESVQDWCGQFFGQLNLKPQKDGYDAATFSYFQSEGDRKFDLSSTLLEDELYTRVRLGPDKLPLGEIQLLPSATYLRLAHKPWEIATATASLGETHKSEFSDVEVQTYTIEYTEPARTLAIHFEASFPFRVVGFEDTYAALFNPKGGEPERLTTVGRLTNSIMLDYWSRHTNGDTGWRQALGLQL